MISRITCVMMRRPPRSTPALTLLPSATLFRAENLLAAAAKPGDIIILSPASASFDLYPNFEVRGREFKKIVNALK